jgi:hypothetical protein
VIPSRAISVCAIIVAAVAASSSLDGCGPAPDVKAADAVYDQLLVYIRNANSAMSLPNAGFDSMLALQQRVSVEIPGLELRKLCNGTLSYSLSALPGKIAIWVKCNAAEKRGEWVKP